MEKLEQGQYYHIYNRGINGGVIFKDDTNMYYFLKLIEKHLTSKVSILAYCLMNNHFHLAVEIIAKEEVASQALSNLFNAYAKAFNKQNSRTGTLFERPFKRVRIANEEYLKNLVLYIHKNPENHKLVTDFSNYKFSSYQKYFLEENSILKNKRYIVRLFDDIENFVFAHTKNEILNVSLTKDLSGFQNLTGLRQDSQNLTGLNINKNER